MDTLVQKNKIASKTSRPRDRKAESKLHQDVEIQSPISVKKSLLGKRRIEDTDTTE